MGRVSKGKGGEGESCNKKKCGSRSDCTHAGRKKRIDGRKRAREEARRRKMERRKMEKRKDLQRVSEVVVEWLEERIVEGVVVVEEEVVERLSIKKAEV